MQELVTRLTSRIHQNPDSGADAADIASRVVSLWHDIAAAYSPIIGRQGYIALLRRALSMSLAEIPWLADALSEDPADDEIKGLRRALSRQSASDMIHANAALLRQFFDLLASFIGAALTEKLLREALEHSSDTARQEESP